MNTDTSFDANPPVPTNAYDQSIRLFCGAYEPMFTMAYAALKSTIADDATVLIVGAGTGMEICTFAPLSPGWKMTGVDPSADMLALAQQKMEAQRLGDGTTLFQGYTHDLPEDDLYDAATCILVMHFMPDDGGKLQLLQSIAQRLKPGAPLVLVDGLGDTASAEFQQVASAWQSFAVAMGVAPDVVADGFDNKIMKLIQFVPEDRIKALLHEAGFTTPARFFTSFLYGGWIVTKK